MAKLSISQPLNLTAFIHPLLHERKSPCNNGSGKSCDDDKTRNWIALTVLIGIVILLLAAAKFWRVHLLRLGRSFSNATSNRFRSSSSTSSRPQHSHHPQHHYRPQHPLRPHSAPAPHAYHQSGPFASPNHPHAYQTIHVPVQPRAVYPSARYVLVSPGIGHPPHLTHLQMHAPHQHLAADVPRYDPDNLPSYQVTEEEGKNPCPICLAPLIEENVSSGQCLHLMHTSCLKSWLVKDVKSACPVCRITFEDPLDEDEEEPGVDGQGHGHGHGYSHSVAVGDDGPPERVGFADNGGHTRGEQMPHADSVIR